jgi:hypothetical protein
VPEPRQYTVDEVRESFLRYVWTIIEYWEKENLEPTGGATSSVRGKLEGVAFSIMSALDGSPIGLPAFAVLPAPHPDDQEYCRTHGHNWFPSGGDIGPLHEHFFKYKPKLVAGEPEVSEDQEQPGPDHDEVKAIVERIRRAAEPNTSGEDREDLWGIAHEMKRLQDAAKR